MGVITGREREKEGLYDKIQYKLIKMLREYIVYHLSSSASKRNWRIVGLRTGGGEAKSIYIVHFWAPL